MREIYTPRLGLKQPGTVRRDRTLGKSTSQVHRIVKNRAKPDEEVVQEQQEEEQLGQLQSEVNKNRRRRRKGDSTDGIASALTRRFGLAGGLAWFGVLAAGVIGEQVKTRLEKRNEEQSTRNVQKAEAVSTASGLSIIDTKIGGGSFPRTGDLVVLQYKLVIILNLSMYTSTDYVVTGPMPMEFSLKILPKEAELVLPLYME